MRPQDIVILLKILCYGNKKWYSKDLAADLFLSSAEVSNSLERSAISGLIDGEKKKVRTSELLGFLVYGMPYVFPLNPSIPATGIFTAGSHPVLRKHFAAEQQYVWPDPSSEHKGLSIEPLYPGVAKAVKKDDKLYLMLALLDVLRSEKTEEKKAATAALEKLMGK